MIVFMDNEECCYLSGLFLGVNNTGSSFCLQLLFQCCFMLSLLWFLWKSIIYFRKQCFILMCLDLRKKIVNDFDVIIFMKVFFISSSLHKMYSMESLLPKSPLFVSVYIFWSVYDIDEIICCFSLAPGESLTYLELPFPIGAYFLFICL